MTIKYAPRSKFPRDYQIGPIAATHPEHQAWQRFVGEQRKSGAFVFRELAMKSTRYRQLLNEETEAYAKDINHTEDHSPKIDIIRRIEDDKAIHDQ